jgi:adenylate kinase
VIVLLIGAPGAGKGTQAELISDRLGYSKVSTGDALRKHIKEETQIGLLVKDVMARGDLVSDAILLEILRWEFDRAKDREILLDGYPRNLSQAEALGAIAGHQLRAVVHLDVPEGVLVRRLSGRRVCVTCASTFHLDQLPVTETPLCLKCGDRLVQRPDDSEESVRNRLSIYEKQTHPLIDYYQRKGLYQKVDGNGATEEIFARVSALLR